MTNFIYEQIYFIFFEKNVEKKQDTKGMSELPDSFGGCNVSYKN